MDLPQAGMDDDAVQRRVTRHFRTFSCVGLISAVDVVATRMKVVAWPPAMVVRDRLSFEWDRPALRMPLTEPRRKRLLRRSLLASR
jgi:hypothetical protein